MDGRMQVDVMQGWGDDVSITLPLDPPPAPTSQVAAWNLAPREAEVLGHLAAGLGNRAMASVLGISENTVKFHIRNLLRKLQVTSRTEAMALAHHHGVR